ncbi:patatin [Agromyces luteolus]|uniref:Patatin-like phospholipase family protein n=1 Tax=Agromyces luteolus TaxID=88373 RepID=A0A7C9HIX5_9MICO|nr:patatin-like phospholipase family protein [Agromyces luteolus]MUN08168.1 patatin-like phospholipase family protein [Agromyces luteolus]GLK27600.1 patatin [Agromyces luteolus]
MDSGKVAFVLGGGGVLGAVQVGMLRAVLERGIRPDLVVGTSIGAINGAIIAADVDRSLERLEAAWSSKEARAITSGVGLRLGRAHVMSTEPLRRMLVHGLGGATEFEDLDVAFRCCAASVERAAEHWFDSGPLVPAVLASAALPGLFPAVRIGEEHFIDGGIVNSIPVGQAADAGATDIYVMQVGRIEHALTPPRNQFDNARVAFEISRRHRFARDRAALTEGTRLHVLPTGTSSAKENRISRNLSPAALRRRMATAHGAASAYLDREDEHRGGAPDRAAD